MDDKCTVKEAALKWELKSFLGTSATEEGLFAVFSNLIASGAVVKCQASEMTYPRFK